MALPPWLDQLRREQIINVVRNDPRSCGNDVLLGVPKERIFAEVIEGGQADFDAPWEHLSTDDRVLLYAYYNQLGHLEELVHAFTQLLGTSSIEDPVVLDLGCGPYTGGLALGSVLGPDRPFTYVGVDRAPAMHRLGERLAAAAVRDGRIVDVPRHWTVDLDSLPWTEPPSWRHVVVIVSYLLASPTLDAVALVDQLERALARIGRGSVTLLYTNSYREAPNQRFPAFRSALERGGFETRNDADGAVEVDRWDGARTHRVRYALFCRRPQTILHLDDA